MQLGDRGITFGDEHQGGNLVTERKYKLNTSAAHRYRKVRLLCVFLVTNSNSQLQQSFHSRSTQYLRLSPLPQGEATFFFPSHELK